MRILMTGASGYIGSKVAELLLKSNHEIAALSFSPNLILSSISAYHVKNSDDIDTVQLAFKEFQPEVVLHLGAKWKAHPNDDLDASFIDANLTFPTLVLNEAISKHVKFINICSYWQISTDEFMKRNSNYVLTKNAFKYVAENLSVNATDLVTNIFLFDNYGPMDPRGKFITALLGNAMVGHETTITNPNTYLNLLHVDDIAVGILKIIETNRRQSTYEICATENWTLLDIVNKIESILGIKLVVKYEEKVLELVSVRPHRCLYSRPANWKPRTNFESGIRNIWVNEFS